MDNRPIGIFDSGVGGLTVAKEVMKRLPNEKIIYFGDLARLPYGSKSKENITKFSRQIIRFLLTKNVKAIIIACGTASSNSLDIVRKEFDIPIMGIIKPGARAAAKASRNSKVGIIGTEATIESGAFEQFIRQVNGDLEVYTKACPLFVPLVEEGWHKDEVTYEVTKRYLKNLIEHDVDTIVLGCTHYPLLKKVIGDVVGEKVLLINPAEETAKQLSDLLEEQSIKNNSQEIGQHEFYVSDSTQKFEALAKCILQKPMMPVQKINIEDY